MSGLDRALRALGIALSVIVTSWLLAFGVAFIVDDARHQRATVGGVGGGAWLIAPVMATVIGVIIALVSLTDGMS